MRLCILLYLYIFTSPLVPYLSALSCRTYYLQANEAYEGVPVHLHAILLPLWQFSVASCCRISFFHTVYYFTTISLHSLRTGPFPGLSSSRVLSQTWNLSLTLLHRYIPHTPSLILTSSPHVRRFSSRRRAMVSSHTLVSRSTGR